MPKTFKCPRCGTKITLMDAKEKEPVKHNSGVVALMILVAAIGLVLLFATILQQGV